VVDDDTVFLDKMKKNLSIDRHSIITAHSGEEALEITSQVDFDLIITDLKMKKLSGIDLIKKLRGNGIDTITLVLTGYGTINSAVEALKSGAYDYLVKPLRLPILRSKIVEIEKELTLRNKLALPEIPRAIKLSEINKDRFTSPFLVISTRDPADIIENLGLSDASTARVSYTQEQGKIAPSKLHQLRNTIEDFVKKQEKGTIIFDGIQDILVAHGWKKFKKFIKYLQKEVVSSDYTMLFLIGEENDNEQYDEILLHDGLSILSIHAFETIIDIISHTIRKNVITLLKTHGPTKFTKIADELGIESTATLTFHIKKLVQESILTKKDSSYTLTTRGEFIDEIIFGLEKAGIVDPGSSVKVLRYQRI
jgi:CheY-like chemotaxis protein/DNA-binding HxlR family transcriptional regulator